MHGMQPAGLLRASSPEVQPAISSRSRATTMLGTTATFWAFSTGAACSDQRHRLRANVTVDNVDAYLAELKDRVGSVTVHGSICKLRRAAQFIAPGRDFTWLAEIGKDLALVMRPRSKFDRMVMTEVLVEAGLTLIHEAESSPTLTELARACQVRNGLMVALLALCPIRRKNFAALEIGRSFVEIHGTWWIVLSASETKEKRPDERPINELLTPVIDPLPRPIQTGAGADK